MSASTILTQAPSGLISKVHDYVKEYMSKYDASHDIHHIHRVLGLAHTLAAAEPGKYDLTLITLGALLHDVGDKKYLKPGEDSTTLIRDLLLSFGADDQLASKVQTICLAVSYTSEVKNPQHVQDVLKQYPELAIVQDADRLDAIGAVGIARCFTFGGAKGARSMDDSVDHFVDKLEKLEGMMKTEEGRKMARVRTERIKTLRGWWEEETREAKHGLDGIDGLQF